MTPVQRETPHTIGVLLDDVDDRWTVTISEGPITTQRTAGHADCNVTGPASDIFIALWNHPPSEAMKVTGDNSLVTDLGANVRIRWG